ncbi:MAG: Fic family protein [Acidobacteria bacterium]|nr:Fic family protein [Acidobacteriota bacterium]MCW5969037.1 Fic family protein [Blastocatellales bacterium]
MKRSTKKTSASAPASTKRALKQAPEQKAEWALDARGLQVSHETVQLIAEIDEFKGRWEALQLLSPERLRALRHVATIESIGSSTRIEGVRLTDSQIETLLANLERRALRSRDEEEVAGYAEAMDLIFASWEQLTLTENHIKQLHAVLLKHSGKDEHHRGMYKRAPNNVVAYEASGREIGVIFATCSPFQTPFEMQQLVAWTNQALEARLVHPLLAIAVFVVRLLAIHPFQDGNGRLSRILTTLLLLRTGYAYAPYASLESVIEENKDLYYAALRRTQGTLSDEPPNWEPWVGFFLRCLKKQKDNLAARLAREKLLQQALPALSAQVVALLREHGRLTISDLERLTGANKNTLKVRLRELTEARHIARHGQARATWYTL